MTAGNRQREDSRRNGLDEEDKEFCFEQVESATSVRAGGGSLEQTWRNTGVSI